MSKSVVREGLVKAAVSRTCPKFGTRLILGSKGPGILEPGSKSVPNRFTRSNLEPGSNLEPDTNHKTRNQQQTILSCKQPSSYSYPHYVGTTPLIGNCWAAPQQHDSCTGFLPSSCPPWTILELGLSPLLSHNIAFYVPLPECN